MRPVKEEEQALKVSYGRTMQGEVEVVETKLGKAEVKELIKIT
jgi:hypothetical protein